MKTTLTIILCLACFLQSRAADNKAKLECIYRLTYQVDTLTKRSVNAMMVLRRNEDRSLFYSQANFEKDSMECNASGIEEKRAINDSIKARYGKITASYYVLKDFERKQLDFMGTLLNNNKYTEPLPAFKWQMSEEKKTIGEHQCQKATCTFAGRIYEAWFAPDIPINDGPWKFYGLPGLILEVYDTQHHYEFQFLGMRPCAGKIEIPVEDYTKTTKKEYLRVKQMSIDDPESALQLWEARLGIKTTRPRAPKLRSYATMERIDSMAK
jgi:hypothetical protein